MAQLYPVCQIDELPPGTKRIIDAGGISIGVYNIRGAYYAIRNVCPHQLAPLCEGRITGTTIPGPVGEYTWVKDGEVVRCPWHGWEFDICTGRSVFNPHQVRVKSYPVSVETAAASASDAISDSAVETFSVTDSGGMLYVQR